MWMGVVAVTSGDKLRAQPYLRVLPERAQMRLLTPADRGSSPDDLLNGVGGLFLTGGPDVEPARYGEPPDPLATTEVSEELDALEFGLLRKALTLDMPVLAICRGMQLMNVAFGGKLPRDIPGHGSEIKDDHAGYQRHSIYLSPGCKLAAILGTGGFFKVNTSHHQGLKEAQKSPRLLASAYSLEDAVIEGLESPEHSWVIGVQCRPERQEEVPKVFANLFEAFIDRVEDYSQKSDVSNANVK